MSRATNPSPTALQWVYRIAWRLKSLTHVLLPAPLRAATQDWMFRKMVARPGPRPSAFSFEPWGVNVAGYLRAELGVGEAARATLRALRAADVPACAIERESGSNSRREESAPGELSPDPRFAVNIVHVNPDQFPYAMHEWGPEFSRGRYTIGYWNWELLRFPRRWRDSIRHVDEVWVPSTFCADALRGATTKPVTTVPYALDPRAFSEPAPESAGPFRFLFVFDALSIVERKNPLGLIEAFRRARDQLSVPVELVLKVVNADADPEAMGPVREAARADSAILLIERYLKRDELRALFQSCGAYVSLHRSEGFGLTLAEAMAAGKSVIATAWSANRDFMNEDNALPVRYRIIRLDRHHGPYRRGESWADPDIGHAAECMARVVRDPDLRLRLGQAARAHVAKHLSPEAVGQRIRTRLEAIRKEAGV